MSYDLTIKCKECGEDLESELKRDRCYSPSYLLEVTPCKKCMDALEIKAHGEGYAKGHDEGTAEATP